ncbi:GGDEF domain-containing protein [Sphingomonas colocasiae]|uniref:diguanylate cyclase n=1 Tax=Sphingomonas colocasiae TaxID=1848973 RepID=A0ABS7PX32_9SPHN|nr:diguanylate cyclase [Sphingomonas colocasiae]MBY8825838.1 GGDEF domain-containing protein [Sphingomonas colocasiae]
MRISGILLRAMIALASLLLAPQIAHAADRDAIANRPVCVLPGATSADRIFATSNHPRCGPYGTVRVASAHWRIVSGLSLAATPDDPWTLRWQNFFADRVTIIARYADGETVSAAVADGDVGRYITINAMVGLPLPARAAPITDIAIRVDGGRINRDQSDYFSLARQSEIARDGKVDLLMWGLFAGVALAMLAYNLMLWTVLRFRFLLLYCVSVAAILAYGVTWSGGVFLIDPALTGSDAVRINFFLLACLGGSVLWFATSFFEEWALPAIARRAAGAVAVTLIGAGALFALGPASHIALLDRLYYGVFAIAIPTMPCLCLLAWRRRSAVAWVFAAAWAVPFGAALLRLLNGYDLIPTSISLGNSTFYSMCFESLISTLGIAYRIRQIQRERDAANAERSDLKRLADTDPLTGLLNRRAFLDGAIEASDSKPHRLILLDIDHFKSVNDRHGHLTGDIVLKDFALLLAALAPAGARVGRLGGEEFAVLMAATGRPSDFAADFLTALRTLDCAGGLRITASIGVAEAKLVAAEDWTTLYKAADAALYDAKTTGRNRARIHGRAPDARRVSTAAA